MGIDDSHSWLEIYSFEFRLKRETTVEPIILQGLF